MYAEERRSKILTHLETAGRVDSAELARLFHTSRETIRRDILALKQQGLLIQTHGGAIALEKGEAWHNLPLSLRQLRNTPEKNALCSFAASFIRAFDVLYLDNSTTVAGLLPCLPKAMELTILTNSLKLALESVKYENSRWQIINIGGHFSGKTLSSGGFLATENIRMFRPMKAYLSCQAIDESMQVLDALSDELGLKRYVVSCSQQRFLLVDHTKLNQKGVASFATAGDFTHIVTSTDADKAFVARLQETGAKVHLTSLDGP